MHTGIKKIRVKNDNIWLILENLINMMQNFNLTSFFSGLGLGSILGFTIKKYISKLIDSKFDREDKGYDKLHNRYKKLYSPLVFKMMGIAIESGGKLTFKEKLLIMVKGIFSGNFRYSWNIFRFKSKDTSKEYYLANFSSFNFEGIRKHIKKYHSLADSKLVELLDSAVRAKNEQDHGEALERSTNSSYSNNDYITPEVYSLINHILKYNKYLNDKLYPE